MLIRQAAHQLYLEVLDLRARERRKTGKGHLGLGARRGPDDLNLATRCERLRAHDVLEFELHALVRDAITCVADFDLVAKLLRVSN